MEGGLLRSAFEYFTRAMPSDGLVPLENVPEELQEAVQWIQIGLAAWMSANVALGSWKLLNWAKGNKNTQSATGDSKEASKCLTKDTKKKVSFDLENTKYINKHGDPNTKTTKERASANPVRLQDQKFQERLKRLNDKFQELKKELDEINEANTELENTRQAVHHRETELAQIKSDNESLNKEILQVKTQKKRRGRLSCAKAAENTYKFKHMVRTEKSVAEKMLCEGPAGTRQFQMRVAQRPTNKPQP